MILDAENYWKFYGLKQEPFNTLTDVSANYLPPRWEQIFDALHHLCRTSNSLLVVTGVRSSGKTTFARLYANQADDSVTSCLITATSETNPSFLQLALEQGFNLSERTGDTLEEQLDAHLATLQHSSKICLLIIDNAHTLPTESLQVLFYLIRQQSEAQMRLHVLLVGLPELKDRLLEINEKNNDQEIITCFELSLFTPEEIQLYIHHRFLVAGLPAKIPLNKSSIDTICENSGGNPSEINLLAKRLLISEMKRKYWSPLLDSYDRNKTKLLGGVILLAMLIITPVLLLKAKNSIQGMRASVHSQVANEHSSIGIFFNLKDLLPTFNWIGSPNEIPLITVKTNVSAPQRVVVKTVTPATIPQENKPAVAKVVPTKSKVIYSPQNQKLLALPAEHYTLQLIGLSNKKALQDFIDNNGLNKKAIYYQSRLQNKEWYVLLYGDYVSQLEAKKALEQLPPAVRKENPWVRSIASVQATIQKNG